MSLVIYRIYYTVKILLTGVALNFQSVSLKMIDNITKTLKSVIYAILRPVSASPWIFIFSLLMSWGIAVVGNLLDAPTNLFLSFLLPIADCYLICLLAFVFGKIKMGGVIGLLVIVFLFGELFTVFYYHSLYSTYVILLIIQTNAQESSEFIASAIMQLNTWIAIVLVIIISIITTLLTKLAKREFKGKSIIAFIVFGFIIWSGIRQLSAYTKLERCFRYANVSECVNPENFPHLNTPYVRFLYGMAFNRASAMELKDLENSVASISVDNCNYRCPFIVLIIGESYNKYHSNLYNPHYLQTTPKLEALRDSGNLFVYKDAITPYNFTSSSFKYMFSTWDDSDADDWTQHTLFPAIFKKAGYDVYFITNQFVTSSIGMWDVDGGNIFNCPKLSDLQFTSRNSITYKYDADLLQEIPPIDTLTARPTLLIVHLIGQHVKYNDRFPPLPEWKPRFTSTDAITPYGGDKGRQIEVDYANATYYNDYVVHTIFKMVSHTDAICLYLADHGEEVQDWRDKFNRTNENNLVPEVARYQYEIPFMFYLSTSFIRQHTDIAEQIRTCADRPFISSDLPHVLMWLGGIDCIEYKDNRNILSSQYDTGRKRIIRGDVDYDELMRGADASH